MDLVKFANFSETTSKMLMDKYRDKLDQHNLCLFRRVLVKKNGDFNVISPFGAKHMVEYFNSKLYLDSAVFKAPSLVPLGVYYDYTMYANKTKQWNKILHNINFLKSIFVNIKATDDYYISYHLFSEIPISLNKRFYAQAIDFANLIEEENKTLFKQANSLCINCKTFPDFWEHFNTPLPVSTPNLQLGEVSKFLQESGLLKADITQLTKNELRCLLHSEKGLNANQIALEMDTTVRNVYYFMMSLKEKLGIYSRKELIELAKMIYPFLIDEMAT